MLETTSNSTNSRKTVSSWLKTLPWSQNLSDGVLFCRVLHKVYPSFTGYKEEPRTEYENTRNFKTLKKFLDQESLFRIEDASRFGNSKDFFEFSNWLYNLYHSNLPEESLTSSRISKFRSASEIDISALRVQSNSNIDWFEEYDHDTKNLLALSSQQEQVEHLTNTLADMREIIEGAISIEQLKQSLSRRFYGESASEG